MTQPEISIVVANWNGERFLEDCLGSLWASGEASGRAFELIVVDDVSSDGSVDLIVSRFPQVRLLRNPENLGFARTSNRGAREALGRVVIMMNNDMRVPVDFVGNLAAAFFEETRQDAASTLFAVGAKSVEWQGGAPNHLCMRAAWRRGGIGAEWSDPAERCETTYAQGGAAAYNRALFLRLRGFDPIFHPGYWEDYDVAYRACRAGWRVLYEPRAVVEHCGKSSLGGLLGGERLNQLLERNRLWFTWLNLQDPLLICRHIVGIPWIYARDLAQGKGMAGVKGFWHALAGLGGVLRTRRARRGSDPKGVRTDRELMGF